jgi:HlyD family secretion protein
MKQIPAYCILSGLILLLTTGCRNEKTGIIQYHLNRCDFTEKITAAGTIQAVNSVFVKTPRLGIIKVNYLAEEGAYVKTGDTVCILDGPEMIDRFETLTLEHEKLMAEQKKLVADNAMALSLLEAQMEQNEIQLAINSLDSIQKKFAPPVQQKLMELELEKAKIEKDKLLKKFAAQQRINETEQRGMRSRIMRMENQMQRLQDEINMLTVLAPADGMVMHTESPELMFMSSAGSGTIGGKIEEGSTVYMDMPLLEMPDMSEMQVSMEVAEGDYKRIEAGQKALIRVDAAERLFTTGSVLKKAPVGKNVRRDSDLKTYEVVVSIDSCHSELTPGLSASCDIIIHEVKDTVVVPTIAIHEQDSSKIIYVAQNNRFIPVGIETGLSNSTESIVTKGLKGDETIALAEPPPRLMLKNTRTGSGRELQSDQDSPPDSVNDQFNPELPSKQ